MAGMYSNKSLKQLREQFLENAEEKRSGTRRTPRTSKGIMTTRITVPSSRGPLDVEDPGIDGDSLIADLAHRANYIVKDTNRSERTKSLGLGKEETLSEEVIDVSPKAEAGDQIFVKGNIPEYPEEVTKSVVTDIIIAEAKLRGITPEAAVKLYKAEGFNSYQSTITKGSQKKIGGREASYGPFQLYVGGGLGNDYESQTGRELAFDNTLEGITKQIQFSLDKAAEVGSWGAWSGRKAAGLKDTEGLNNAKPLYNWKEEE